MRVPESISVILGSGWARAVLCAPLAGVVALGLFVVMEVMIRPGAVTLEEDRSITLRDFLADKTQSEVRTKQSKAKQLDKANKPPPPPKLTATREKLDLPRPSLDGAAPEKVDFERINSIDVGAVAIDDRDAQPIRPPLCQFPQRAASRGIEGSCEVRLNVDTRGRPYEVEATCDNSMFVREATRCVGRAEFAPKVVRGKAVERRNVVYPVVFELER